MIKSRYAGPAFAAGDEVLLARGSYQGTPGVFLNLNEDPNWADIRERNGAVRNHPLAWLAHTALAASPLRRGFSILFNSPELRRGDSVTPAGLATAGAHWKIERISDVPRTPSEVSRG